MSIELKTPYTLEEIKKTFKEEGKAQGLLRASSCMCYLTGANDLMKCLKKDGRLDPGLAKELEKLEAQAIGLTVTLMALYRLNASE